MKKYILCLFSTLALLLVGCTNQPPPEVIKCEVTLTEGIATDSQVEFYLSATNAEEVAYLCVNTSEETLVISAETLFETGEVFTATVDPVQHQIENLKPDTEYTVYAASRAKAEDKYYYSDVASIVMNTAGIPKMLEFVSSSKTGFSYKVTVEEGKAYLHTYFEGWFFEYNYEMNKYIAEASGEEFDASVFILNLLATYGSLGKDSQTIDWYAGQESEVRGEVFLVPGIRYYAAAALFDEETGMWVEGEKPEIIQFEMDKPGESSQTVNCTVDGLSPYSVNIRMECDESLVNFYLYDLYRLSDYKTYVSENGIDGMKKYVSEYGYGKGNTYTDTWTVEPGTAYMLCVYGVDYNGDDFYTELQVNVPLPEAQIYLSMEPYERDLEGYNTYNTVKVDASFANFIGLDYEESVFCLSGGPIEKSLFDMAVESVGMSGTLEELQEYGEMMYVLGNAYFGLHPVTVNDAILASLKEKNSFSMIHSGLQPDTEYVYMVVAQYDGKTMCRLAAAKTDEEPVLVEELDAYKAFLGNWTVTGKQTDDWATYNTFNLKIARLTSNRSFKIYGWSNQQVGQDFPFEASFDEATGKIKIQTPQVLGKVTINDYEYEVHFVGKAYKSGSDQLIVLGDYEGLAYVGRINEPYLTLLGEMPQYAGQWWEYKSMSYVLYDAAEKQYYALEPYDLIYFQTVRAN